VKPEEIAVLYRSSRQCDPVEALLQEHGIAYRVLGGQAFYDKKQVKDVLAYFKMIVAPQDDLAARRARRRAVARGRPQEPRAPDRVRPPPQPLADGGDAPQRRDPRAAGALGPGDRPVLGARSSARRPTTTPAARASGRCAAWSTTSGSRRRCCARAAAAEAAAAKWDSVEWMYESLERFEQRARAKGGRPRWQEFFQAMNQDNKQDEPEAGGRGQVTLATLHSAKGLEWRHVFIIGCEEGTMPHKRVAAPRISDAIAGDIEEERRLFYVGITRARDQLYITRAAMRASSAAPRCRASRAASSRSSPCARHADLRDRPRGAAERRRRAVDGRRVPRPTRSSTSRRRTASPS
jgi:superfamily I DNA/RNA helicase